MFQMKPGVTYLRYDSAVKALLRAQSWIEPGETVGVGCMQVQPNGKIDKRVAAAYVITDGRHFKVYGTGKLAHIVYGYLCAQDSTWRVYLEFGADAPDPDYLV